MVRMAPDTREADIAAIREADLAPGDQVLTL